MIFVPEKEADNSKLNLLNEEGASIYPIKTHLLSDEDDLADVISKYVSNFSKKGDIITIAESPAAITQGRFKLPQEIKVGWWAKRLCYFIPSVGSLSTPYGMQCAIDQIGINRFLFAMFIGAFMKLLGKNGWLYTIAGIESELIDDLTGTIPPYDQYIVLGPKEPEKLVNYIKGKTGLDIAIVDANDLKKARIVASTIPNMEDKIKKWMLNNPAGNSYEQTPIVLIRPSNF
jgi:F420-0:gamma-glutamyl ligase